MNRIKQISLLLILYFISTNVQAQVEKAAVVSFYTNKVVGFSEISGPGTDVLLEKVLNLSEDPDFNLQPMLNKFHEQFFTKYAKDFQYDFLPEDEVTSNPEYINFVPTTLGVETQENDRLLSYGNYKAIYEGALGKANEEGMAKIFKDKAERTIYVSFSFEFVNSAIGIGSTGLLKIRATMRIAVYDKAGKKVFIIREGANSKQTVVKVKGIPIMDASKILPMCESALDELMKDMDKKLEKRILKELKNKK
ncbi:hypothetical protein E0W68_10500 [Flavobacterium salilacus subsp. salilacus]|uniref:hypothetical protein n=1 Tax=Flavobacterium TaxID=237 RepID=UPI001075686D|nr:MULTISPECIES: hypothetical protein [Flavobacterium]KAF2518159.1 hypothetical protein E0W68_10500 [Flavobacterium salilacus subsp. salilacus]MBE1615531.1 hypothetical protein [Flavobacterium sp. SaA2.13]NDI99319.1 hypothetical protein [Flavobacterium salilacus subsp. altitudinum]